MRWSSPGEAIPRLSLLAPGFSLRPLLALCVLCGQKLLIFVLPVLVTLAWAQSAPGSPAIVPEPPPPALLILIDPAHGGSDSGAALNAAFPEKDVTLVLARRLRQELATRGVRVQLLRDSDITLSPDQRAATVNASRPALYIVIHATSQGSGVRLFTAILPIANDNHGPFTDWNTAQASHLPRSRSLVVQIAAAMQKSTFPVHSLSAPLRPLNNVVVPALAIEIAPTAGDVSQLAASDFQQSICAALGSGIASVIPALQAQAAQ